MFKIRPLVAQLSKRHQITLAERGGHPLSRMGLACRNHAAIVALHLVLWAFSSHLPRLQLALCTSSISGFRIWIRRRLVDRPSITGTRVNFLNTEPSNIQLALNQKTPVQTKAKCIDSPTSADCLVDSGLDGYSSALIRCETNHVSKGKVLLLIPSNAPSDAWKSSDFSQGKKKKRHWCKQLAGRLESCAHSYGVLGIGTSTDRYSSHLQN